MNLAVTNTRTIKLVKQHSIAAFGGLCIALAAAAGGVLAVSQTGSGTTSTVAPRADYTWTRTSADDWRTIYYLVPTQELADQILREEAEQQNVIIENSGQLPARTIRRDRRRHAGAGATGLVMMADALADTTSFVDLRYPPIPAINSSESSLLSQAGPLVDGDVLPTQSEPVQSYQP